jgi:transcription initiation factor TFIIF subunit alpha
MVKPKRKKTVKEELDFEEDFADDEVVELGLDDEEEVKEASKRLFGKAGKQSFFHETSDISDPEEDRKEVSAFRKTLQKSLLKIEKNDAYEYDEENPYISAEVFLYFVKFRKTMTK